MTIFFVFTFFSLFVPRDNQWLFPLFLIAEAGAATLYIVSSRRERKNSGQRFKLFT